MTPPPLQTIALPPIKMTRADPTPDMIATLAPGFQPYAVWLITQLRQAGLPAIITSAKRSYLEQVGHVISGASQTTASKHIDGLAFDIDMAGYAPASVPTSVWRFAGGLGESVGMVWGGRWVRLRDFRHFEMPK